MDWFAAHSYNRLGARMDDDKSGPISLPTPTVRRGSISSSSTTGLGRETGLRLRVYCLATYGEQCIVVKPVL
jgi:hypothetical protein